MIEVISLHSILNILYEKFLSPKVNNNLPKINHRVQTYTDDQDPKIDTSQCPVFLYTGYFFQWIEKKKLSCGGNGKRSWWFEQDRHHQTSMLTRLVFVIYYKNSSVWKLIFNEHFVRKQSSTSSIDKQIKFMKKGKRFDSLNTPSYWLTD